MANTAFQKQNSISPTGSVVDFAGSTAPTGWLICNGATVSQTTYAALYAVTGHSYGSDPGGGNFILPDCRGKATVGYLAADSNFGALGNVAAGEKTHTLTSGESGLVGHNHTQNAHSHTDPPTGSYGGGTNPRFTYLGADGAPVLNTGDTTATNQAVAAANASSAHNNIQPSIVFNKIIKY
jgi:microcystin-dependent protein